MTRRLFVIVAALFALLTTSLMVTAQGNSPARPQGVASHIIVFNDNFLPDAVPEFAAANNIQITRQYRHALNGVAAVVPAGRLNALKNDPRVAYVQENGKVQLYAQSVPTGIDRSYASSNANIDIDGQDDYRVDVDVAVIDTGVYNHSDLNLVNHVDCTSSSCSTGGGDGNGHGTHVAGTVGALDNNAGVVGVAPGARIHGVKVLSDQGSGYESWIVAGIDYVAANANTIEVANMSLGGAGYSSAEETAINNAVAAGVVFVVAAGNDNDDASNYSPAQFSKVITVSALADFNGQPNGGAAATCRSDVDDTRANFSNYGSVVDIIAPGVCILSTWNDGGYNTISGTSMASPHVAGAAALLASGSNDPQNESDVNAIRNTLLNNGNYNWNTSDDPDGIQEPLLDVTGFNPTLIATGGGGGGGGGGSTAVNIGDLDGSVQYYWGGYYWYATATATVVDGSGNPVSGADVTLSASGAISGSGTCTTGSDGTCSLGTGWLTSGSYVDFTVTDVTASGYTYDSGANTDPDGDSNGTTIRIYR